MKRIIAAALLASLTLPAFARDIGAPFEQTQVDRQLPNVKDPVVTPRTRLAGPPTMFGSADANAAWAEDWNFIAPAK